MLSEPPVSDRFFLRV